MATIARLKNGNLHVTGELNERVPPVTDGLVAFFPMDGRGGTFDGIGGYQPIQNTVHGVNLIEAMAIDWRDPQSWSSHHGMSWDEDRQALRIEGYHNSWLKTPIVVDTTKHYQVSMEVYQEVAPSSGLYLGGLSANAAGERVTLNYDYSYASNANASNGHLPLGEWVTFRVTRYGTGNIASNNSKSFDLKVGWTGTRSGITDLLTKYYYYGGLFNYNSGGVMYIRNLSVVVVDDDNYNMTITDQDVAINEPTINTLSLIANATDIQTWQNYQDGNGTCTIVCTNTKYGSGVRLAGQAMDRIGKTINTGVDVNLNASVASFSIYFKPNKACGILKAYWDTETTTGVRKYSRFSDQPVNLAACEVGAWQRLKSTADITPELFGNPTAYGNLYVWVECPAGEADVEITCPQLEAKPYVTSFTESSRTLECLQIPSVGLMSVSEGTVSMWIDVNAAILNTTTNRRIFTHMPNGNSNALIFRHDASVGWCFFTSNAAGSGTEVAHSSASTKLGWHHFSLRYAQAESALFVDGIKMSSIDNPSLPAEYTGPIWVGSYADGEACSTAFRDLAIHNRALSDQEIKRMANPACSLRPAGNLVAELREGPMPVPGAHTLFAFDDSLESNSGLQATFTRNSEAIDPSTGKVVPADTPRFETVDGRRGLLVEEATTNLIPSPLALEDASWTKYRAGTGVMPIVTDNYGIGPDGSQTATRVQLDKGSGDTASDISQVFWQSVSGSYPNPHPEASSVWLKTNSGRPTQIRLTQGAALGPIVVAVTDVWQRFATTSSASSSTQAALFLQLRGAYGTANQADILVWHPQVEQKPYATSFVDGTRARETLAVPAIGALEPSAGTIEGWILLNDKIVNGHGYSTFFTHVNPGWPTNNMYLARYNTTEQRLGIRFNGLADSAVSPFALVVGEWLHFAYRWDSEKITAHLNGQLLTETVNTAPNIEFGDNMYVGGFAGGADMSCAPFCGLRLHRRALTDEEIAISYKQQLRILPDRLLMQGQLIEGVVL